MTQGSMPTTGRWGWYRDHEGNEFRRVSTLVKKVETDTYNLDKWKIRQVAEGLAIRDDLVLAVKAMGRPDLATGGWSRDQKRTLDRIADDATQAAKQRDGAKVGTAVHTLTERVDRGEPIEQVAAGLPAEPAGTIRAYALLRELNGWRSVEIERTIVCDELEVAGTFDRVDVMPGLAAMLGPGTCQHGCPAGSHTIGFEVPDGLVPPELPVIVDVKTEESPWLNGLHIGPQLAIYSRARRMWRPTGGTYTVTSKDGSSSYEAPRGEYVPAPCVRQDVAIVVHLRDGKAEPYFVNLVEGWDAAQAAYAQANRETRAKRKLGAQGAWFAAVPNVVRPKVAETFVATAVAAGYGDPARPGPGQVGEVKTVGGIDFTRLRSAEVAWGVPAPMTAAAVTAAGSGPSGADIVGGHGPMPLPGVAEAARRFDEHDELRIELIEQIWKTVTVDGLAILWNMARDRGVHWEGPVAMAADSRKRQIECPQRQMSHAPGTAKCACGWMAGGLP
jgi:hypothetical protein